MLFGVAVLAEPVVVATDLEHPAAVSVHDVAARVGELGAVRDGERGGVGGGPGEGDKAGADQEERQRVGEPAHQSMASPGAEREGTELGHVLTSLSWERPRPWVRARSTGALDAGAPEGHGSGRHDDREIVARAAGAVTSRLLRDVNANTRGGDGGTTGPASSRFWRSHLIAFDVSNPLMWTPSVSAAGRGRRRAAGPRCSPARRAWSERASCRARAGGAAQPGSAGAPRRRNAARPRRSPGGPW